MDSREEFHTAVPSQKGACREIASFAMKCALLMQRNSVLLVVVSSVGSCHRGDHKNGHISMQKRNDFNQQTTASIGATYMELLGILTRLVIHKSGAAPYTAKTGNLKHTSSSLKIS